MTETELVRELHQLYDKDGVYGDLDRKLVEWKVQERKQCRRRIYLIVACFIAAAVLCFAILRYGV